MRERKTIAAFASAYVLSAILVSPTAAQPSEEGQWEPVMTWPLQAVHMLLLKSYKVLVLNEGDDPPNQRLFDPATGATPPVVDPPYNLYCSGHTQLADGKVLFAGGGGHSPFGVRDAATYDPDVDAPGNPWQRMDEIPMPGGFRWYPTATTLGNGKVLLTAGRDDLSYNDDPQPEDVPAVFDATQPAGQQWQRMNPVTASKVVHDYPFMFLLSDGQVFMGGGMWFRMGAGYPPVIHLDTYKLNVVLETWSAAVARAPTPGGSAVMYRPDKIMKGGVCQTTCGSVSAEMYAIDLGTTETDWAAIHFLTHARRHFYLIVMPDGKVLAVGGHLTPEMYDPTADNWTDMDTMTTGRRYHSAAVLLPDARVLIAGGEGQKTAQIFKPPYLFDAQSNPAARPVIANAPDVIVYGTAFAIQTPQAADVEKVVLIGLGAATHSFDQNQRYVELEFVFSTEPDILTVSPPSQWNIAPQSYYMLYILTTGDRPGVLFPSQAVMVKLVTSDGGP